MTPSQAAEAASILVQRRINGSQGDRLPPHCRPVSLVDALLVQDAVTSQWCERMDDTVGGWKCSVPPQDKIIIAPLYTRTIDSVPPASLWPVAGHARVEPELAFFFGKDLPTRAEPYTSEEIDAAISRTHMALELINSRYQSPADCAFPEVLADGLVNQGLFIGPPVDMTLAAKASTIAIRITTEEGEVRELAGAHPNLYPRAPLYWLVEFLRRNGQGIAAGQAIITGSYAGAVDLPLSQNLVISYAGLGEMAVRFIARSLMPAAERDLESGYAN